VAFGLSTLLQDLRLVDGNAAYLVLLVVGVLDTWLLYRFFLVQNAAPGPKDPAYTVS